MVEYDSITQYDEFGESKLFHVIGKGRNPVKLVEEGIKPGEKKDAVGKRKKARELALSELESLRPSWYDNKHEDHVFLWPNIGDAIESSMRGGNLSTPIAVIDMERVPCECRVADSQLSAIIFGNAKKEVLGKEDQINLKTRDAVSKYWDSLRKLEKADLEGLELQEIEVMCPCKIPGEAIDRIITDIHFEV